MTLFARTLIIATVAAIAACSPSGRTTDAGTPLIHAGVDAGTPDAGLDAGTSDAVVDAGLTDAGVDAGSSDAGVDAGLTDAGVDVGSSDAGVDVGSSDAGVDAGSSDADVDAGSSDAGVDAGTSDAGVDAGLSDAGADAGSSDAGVDAGSSDAGADGGTSDAGVDAGSSDAGVDAGSSDAGVDAGTSDAGVDAGSSDAGVDAGTSDADVDAGTSDAGVDAGTSDAGQTDAGIHCGGTNAISDTFPGSDPLELWSISSYGGASAAETGGEAVVTLPSNTLGSTGGSFSSNRYYDMRGDAVWVEVVNAANTATTASSYFMVSDGTDYIDIYQERGTLHFDSYVGGTYRLLKSTLYNATSHLYWRFREDGVNTYWETSADGHAWTVQSQIATTELFSLQYVQIVLGGVTMGGEVSPGSARFAELNGGGAPIGAWCPVASIFDDFAASTPSAEWLRSFSQSPETVAQGSGQLVLTLSSSGAHDAAYVSSASYDLTNSAIFVQVSQTANTATTAQTYLALEGAGENAIFMLEESGQLVARVVTAGTAQNVGSVLYDPTQHAWWRMRESGGTLYWETAPDGHTWTVQQELTPLPFAIDALDVYVGSETVSAVANPGESIFRNLDVSPP